MTLGLTLVLAGSAAFGQDVPPTLPPPDSTELGPLPDGTLPSRGRHAALPEFGFCPLDLAYGLSIDWFGRDRTDAWIKKGLESLEKNLYRKYYIEGGLFLIQLPDPNDPTPDNDHMFYIPNNPGDDPRVIFMKDIHRLEESGRGMTRDILRSLLEGDKDLLKLAGRAMFDSKFNTREWNFVLGEKNFTGDKDNRPYYYKFRQSGFTKIKFEAGLGHSLQLGDAPVYLGGSLGVEAHAKYRSSGLGKDAVPRAKIGLWGKLPFSSGTSWGLTAIQGWHAEGGVFETEFRAGLFHGTGSSSLGAMAYKRITGRDPLSREGDATGAQVFWSPSETVSFYLSYERSESRGSKDDQRFLLGVDFLGRRNNTADVAGWTRRLLGPVETPETLKAFYGLCRAGAETIPARLDPQGLMSALRLRELESLRDFVLLLPGGGYLVLKPGELLESARAIERWAFSHPPDRREPPLPGWATVEVQPRPGPEVVRELLRRIPPAELDGATGGVTPALVAHLERMLLIHAAAVRRNVDFRVSQATLLLATVARQARDDPLARNSSYYDDPEAAGLWVRISRSRQRDLEDFVKTLGRASAWIKQEFGHEAEKLTTLLSAHGADRIAAAQKAPGWPPNLEVFAHRDFWPPVLAGYGEAFVGALLTPFYERAKAPDAPQLGVTLGYIPLPSSIRLKRLSPGSYYLEIPEPRPEIGRRAMLDFALPYIREALANP